MTIRPKFKKQAAIAYKVLKKHYCEIATLQPIILYVAV